jgi:hypothetical protein
MKEYTVSIGGFSAIYADSPLEAAKQLMNTLKNIDLDSLVYDVVDEETKLEYSVDLSEEEEEYAVLPKD